MSVAVICWAAVSDDPLALRLRNLVNRGHVQTVTPASLLVKQHDFSSYKIVVPAGATQVSLSGDFGVTGGVDQEIEVYLMSADAFVSWQDGYTGTMYYDSGKVNRGSIEATLPPNADTYYLIFDNRSSARIAKSVQAEVTLHYDRWWPIF